MDRPISRRSLLSGVTGAALAVAFPGSPVASEPQVWTDETVVEEDVMERSEAQKRTFRRRANAIITRHNRQTADEVAALQKLYQRPLIGRVKPWDLMERLALCVDPTDMRLGCASQYVHVLQILQGMQRDGQHDEDMLLIAMLHDIGKVLLLHGVPPDQVVGLYNSPIGAAQPKAGLTHCTFAYGHDEFAWERLKDLVPEHVSWTIRYHAINMQACEKLMTDAEQKMSAGYLKPFVAYDRDTKGLYAMPTLDVAPYRALLEKQFPKGLLI